MKLNDFLEKSPKPRSTKQKVITVANEKKENELVVKIQALQKELDKEKKITKVNKKNNTTQENLNKNIQKGIGTY